MNTVSGPRGGTEPTRSPSRAPTLRRLPNTLPSCRDDLSTSRSSTVGVHVNASDRLISTEVALEPIPKRAGGTSGSRRSKRHRSLYSTGRLEKLVRLIADELRNAVLVLARSDYSRSPSAHVCVFAGRRPLSTAGFTVAVACYRCAWAFCEELRDSASPFQSRIPSSRHANTAFGTVTELSASPDPRIAVSSRGSGG